MDLEYLNYVLENIEEEDDDKSTFTPKKVSELIDSKKQLTLDNCERVIKLDAPSKTSKHPWYGMSLSTINSCPWEGDCKDICYRKRDERRWGHVLSKGESNYTIISELNTVKDMADLLENSIKSERGAMLLPVFRIHNGGDFFSGTYMDAWIEVAKRMKTKKLFYTYTTSIPLLVKRLKKIPGNLVINCSYDTTDYNKKLILKHKLKTAFVVDSYEQAEVLNLKVDEEDELAWRQENHFALIQHNPIAKREYKEKIRNRTQELKEFLHKLRN